MADLAQLAAPFDPSRVSWRIGSTTEREGNLRGMALAYVDARDIMDRLDAVVGPANWQDKYRREHETTICSLSLRIDGEWVTKEDGSGDTDVEAEKGALSKALVRAAVKWQIGRYLYDVDSPWVECEKRGKSAIIKRDEYAKLESILRRQLQSAVRVACPATVAQKPAPAPTKSATAPAKRVDEPTPFDDPSPHDEYVAACRRRISASTDAQALRTWWQSSEERDARRDFELTQDEVDSLKTALSDRLQTIGRKEAA